MVRGTTGARRAFALVAMLAAAMSPAAAQQNEPPLFDTLAAPLPALDSARLIADLSALAADSMEGRFIGTRGSARARAYLLSAFKRIGVAPLNGRSEMSFSVKVTGSSTNTGVNVVGVIPGTRYRDRYIVLSAHYDHLGSREEGIYNGADDNASGTAGVLAIASWFKAHPPENSILLAFFDGEEVGLLGSKVFVDRPPVPLTQIIADVNLDMVSRNDRGELYAAGGSPWPVMAPLLDSVTMIARVKLLRGHDRGLGMNNWTDQSDQGSFHAKRIPFVYFGVEDHADYHRPTDKVARIQPGFYYNAVRTIAEFVRRLDLALDRVEVVRGGK